MTSPAGPNGESPLTASYVSTSSDHSTSPSPVTLANTTTQEGPQEGGLQTPLSDPLDCVLDFFSWRPELLLKGKRHTTSEKTRAPASFDRHLDSTLQLKHVVYAPGITEDLANIAIEALKNSHSSENLPSISEHFPQQDMRQTDFTNATLDPIICEREVEKIYRKTTGKFCARVAATLELQLPTWHHGNLKYTLERYDKTYGIADGFLKIDKNVHPDGVPLSADYTMVANTFPTLAVWEFKNLKAGKLEVMEAIVQQAASSLTFPWEGCEYGNSCGTKHGGKNGKAKVTGSKMGFDADNPPCICIENLIKNKPDSPSAPPTKKSQRSAGHITQQVWAEAVQEDATFIVINSGNYEIICIRHRETQTLYISNVIVVKDCNYAQIHTGLFIAALRDAKNRALQLAQHKPQSWTKPYGENLGEKLEPASILEEACKRKWLVMRRAKKNTSFISFNPDDPYCRDNPGQPLFSLHKQKAWDPERSIRINVDAQFAPFIAKGHLDVDGNRFNGISEKFGKTVVIKSAHTEADMNKLSREHKVYLDLVDAGVEEIPGIIGLFIYANVNGLTLRLPSAVLVLEDVGVSVEKMPEELTREHLTSFQVALNNIHNAGFIHGNLTRSNLIIRDANLGRVAIVSFGNARRAGADEQEDEYKSLLRLLPNPLKTTIDRNPTDAYKEAFPSLVLSKLDTTEETFPRRVKNKLE